jgi:hypothetical protein
MPRRVADIECGTAARETCVSCTPQTSREFGIIMSYPSADELERIYWHCPVCNDNGFISGWQDTLWDGFAVSEQAH